MPKVINRSFAFLLLIYANNLIAQTQVRGSVSNTENNAVAGVHVLASPTNIASITDSLGQFEITIPSNQNIALRFSHIAYRDTTIRISAKSQQYRHISVKLKAKQEELREVTIKSERNTRSKNTIVDIKKLEQIPLAGSGAVEQLIKTLPGVNSNNELSSQYSVRGGNYDENLVYINEIEIYRPHLIRSGQQEGLSIINPFMVSSIQFSSGAFEAKYGDKLSSVLDIKYKNPSKWEASAETSLLGANLNIADQSKNKKWSYLAGIRYKTNRYLLSSLDTKGDYQPNYTDFQSLITYRMNSSLSLQLWTSFSKNQYNFEPKNRSTSFGTISDALQLDIYFDGKEKDEFKSNIQALRVQYHPNSNSLIRWIASRYKSNEAENFDIMGQYYLSDLFVTQGGTTSESLENLGIGTFIDHARNRFENEVFSLSIKGDHSIKNWFVQWGITAKHEDIHDRINEWQYQDSAGYALPYSANEIQLASSRNAINQIKSNRISGFVQASKVAQLRSGEFQFHAGIRYHYWDYQKKSIASPRASIYFIPKWKNKMRFKLAAGLYQQIPTYREMLKIDGNISERLKVQRSAHFVLGQEYYFSSWNRPFKFSSEIYYKNYQSVTPYDIENLRIRYYADKQAKAYAAGLDMRINGEFIPGIESWASLSLMKTKENILGDGQSYLPRPTDQRFNFAMFFQDYLPNNPSYKMNLSLFYGGKLPVWAPKKGKEAGNFRMPNYRRIDLGFSKVLVDEKSKKTGLLKHFKSMWIGLELFNVLDINNTVSYLWITDISGKQYAIPNYLTGRKLNLKLSAKF